MNSKFAKIYQYNELNVQVVTPSLTEHNWLEEFFCPHFKVVDRAIPDYRIYFKEDTTYYNKLLSQKEQSKNELVNCFLLDNRAIRLPRFKITEHKSVIFDDNFRVFYLIDADKLEIYLWTIDNNFRARIALMRVIRELTMNYLIGKPSLIIHGSAFVSDRKAIITVGNKGAGKTTFLLHNLQTEKHQYLSNDRLFISQTNEEYLVQGIPTIAAILPSTLEILPNIKSRLDTSFFQTKFTIEEAKKSRKPPQTSKNGKIGLTPAQLCQITDTVPISEAKAWAIIFPKITNQQGGMKFKKLSEKDAEGMFDRAIFGGYTWHDKHNAFNLRSNQIKPDKTTLKKYWKDSIEKVNCYQCELGTEAYLNPDCCSDFIKILE